jgi:hypothetical protein
VAIDRPCCYQQQQQQTHHTKFIILLLHYKCSLVSQNKPTIPAHFSFETKIPYNCQKGKERVHEREGKNNINVNYE